VISVAGPPVCAGAWLAGTPLVELAELAALVGAALGGPAFAGGEIAALVGLVGGVDGCCCVGADSRWTSSQPATAAPATPAATAAAAFNNVRRSIVTTEPYACGSIFGIQRFHRQPRQLSRPRQARRGRQLDAVALRAAASRVAVAFRRPAMMVRAVTTAASSSSSGLPLTTSNDVTAECSRASSAAANRVCCAACAVRG